MFFTEPGDPRQICYRESIFEGERYHFCSDHCKSIFDHEPEKYVQSWLPVHQIYQGNCFKPGTDPSTPEFDPIKALLDYYEINNGRDNFWYENSEDYRNFRAWSAESRSN
jgi:phenol hydroxylase P3 protein